MAAVGERPRLWIVISVMLAAACVICWRLVAIHLKLTDLPVRDPRYLFTREIPGLRGGVYSSAGSREPFACSVPMWEYRADPQSVRLKKHSREDVVTTVAQALALDPAKVRDAFWRTDSRYVYLGRSFDDAAHRTLTDSAKVSGLVIDELQERRYPQGRMLSHVLGYVSKNRDNPAGSAGLEMRYENFLKGKAGRITGMRDARRR
jgi:cell division protein FtsI/penicillin-binding protein 2